MKPFVEIPEGQSLDQMQDYLSDKSSEFDIYQTLSPEQRSARFMERKRAEVLQQVQLEKKRLEFHISRLDADIAEARGKSGMFDSIAPLVSEAELEQDPKVSHLLEKHRKGQKYWDIPTGTDPYPVY